MNPTSETDVLAYAYPVPHVPWWRRSPVGVGALGMALVVAAADAGVRAGAMLMAWDILRQEVILTLAFGVLIVLPALAAGAAVWSLVRPGERWWYGVTALVIVTAHGWAVVWTVLNDPF